MARSAGGIAMVLALSSVACGPPSAEAPTLLPAADRRVLPVLPLTTRFDCAGGIVTATFHENRAVLDVAARTLTLPHVMAASGARYTDGMSTFWSKGRGATFETDGRTVACMPVSDPWQQAMERGIEFRAVGQEPGWVLEIDDGARMHLLYDYAEHEVTMPAPPPVRTDVSTTYEAATPMHRLRVVVEARPCADAMSGDASPVTVAVVIDGRTLGGCGRFLNQSADAPAR